ncbi:LytR C-terminal domain-containing protein [Nocardia sp. NBC_00565]|uniref:LytR C-terminal domain-containing protein n=1 Tax=Nocardia sp. NBC_00565 TaxID=2975993 RepID=UPI002E80F161|nr:LytR C-terminal domain-containing protein [Nocardia sp. NBC_00565]WUC01409.1 LytR C-terminal domain-containing protein [Nocardia sp. NBC_00565]
MSYPNPTSGGPPLRALAMVLIALAIVFAGLGAMSLSSSDSDTSGAGESTTTPPGQAATTTVAATTTAGSTSTTTKSSAATTTPTTSTANRAVPVRVLNNSTVAGLAARTASELTANGWTVAEVGNYPGPNVTKTTVYYGNSSGEKEAALAIADELGASAEPRTDSSGSGVTVVVTGN